MHTNLIGPKPKSKSFSRILMESKFPLVFWVYLAWPWQGSPIWPLFRSHTTMPEGATHNQVHNEQTLGNQKARIVSRGIEYRAFRCFVFFGLPRLTLARFAHLALVKVVHHHTRGSSERNVTWEPRNIAKHKSKRELLAWHRRKICRSVISQKIQYNFEYCNNKEVCEDCKVWGVSECICHDHKKCWGCLVYVHVARHVVAEGTAFRRHRA
jgi:hypothetical protein